MTIKFVIGIKRLKLALNKLTWYERIKCRYPWGSKDRYIATNVWSEQDDNDKNKNETVSLSLLIGDAGIIVECCSDDGGPIVNAGGDL